MDGGQVPSDLSLMLPHYRARHQPVNHRMTMCVAGQSEPIKVKVVSFIPPTRDPVFGLRAQFDSILTPIFVFAQCRTFPTTKFYLEVLSVDGDVTIWIPSDFKGHIHHPGKATLSPGFINKVLRNARINKPESHHEKQSYSQQAFTPHPSDDEIVVVTRGQITFRIWDVENHRPENVHKESLKRIFGSSKKATEAAIDWDSLLRN